VRRLKTRRHHAVWRAVHEKRVTPFEALPGKVRNDAALELATDPMRRENLCNDKEIVVLLAHAARGSLGASDSVAP
jgi:hypothetical protein